LRYSLLVQTTIPFTMIISCVFLVRKYTTAQLYGVLWVMVGIAGVMTVKFYLAGQSQSTQLWAAALLVCASHAVD
jgi:drug/metabolite transporter (DMT)-like permease